MCALESFIDLFNLLLESINKYLTLFGFVLYVQIELKPPSSLSLLVCFSLRSGMCGMKLEPCGMSTRMVSPAVSCHAHKKHTEKHILCLKVFKSWLPYGRNQTFVCALFWILSQMRPKLNILWFSFVISVH